VVFIVVFIGRVMRGAAPSDRFTARREEMRKSERIKKLESRTNLGFFEDRK
jgi:hypothetical protein